MLLEDFENIIDKLVSLNEDFGEQQPVPEKKPAPKQVEQPVKDQETSKPADVRTKIRKAMEPSVEVAKSIIKAIGNIADNNCNGSKKMKEQEQQVKNFEKQARGACEQVVSIVDGNNFAADKYNSSPHALNIIRDNSSRDVDAVKLSLAIITFYNSLG